MSESQMILWVDTNHFSPWAMAASVYLNERGIPFQQRAVDLNLAENLSDDFKQIALTRRIPCLQHGEFTLNESTAICEYLEEVFTSSDFPALYPQSLQERARARELQAWIRSDLAALRKERPTEVLFAGQPAQPLSAAARNDAEKLIAAVQQRLTPEQETLFKQWSIVDLDLAIMLKRLCLADDGLPAWQAAYAERQWCRPSVLTWLAATTEG